MLLVLHGVRTALCTPLHSRLNLIKSYIGARMSAKITHSELLKRLRALTKALRAINMINRGGCGVVAGIVGEHLERLGVPVEVVTPSKKDCTWLGAVPATVRARIEEHWGGLPETADNEIWDEHGLWRNHLALRFRSNGRTYTWDSTGTLRSATMFGRLDDQIRPWHVAEYAFGLGMTVRECKHISRSRRGWNSAFDRAQVPTIRAMAREAFKGAAA